MRAIAFLLFGTSVWALSACTNEVEAGRATYASLCAGCHGEDGRGRGEGLMRFAVHPLDLTQLAARNGGAYPKADVLANLESHTKLTVASRGPTANWAQLDGRVILVETAEGVLTPVTEPLVALSAYLESIQSSPVK